MQKYFNQTKRKLKKTDLSQEKCGFLTIWWQIIFWICPTFVCQYCIRAPRLNFHCYTQCEPTPTQKSAWKWQLGPFMSSCMKDYKGHSLNANQLHWTAQYTNRMTRPVSYKKTKWKPNWQWHQVQTRENGGSLDFNFISSEVMAISTPNQKLSTLKIQLMELTRL